MSKFWKIERKDYWWTANELQKRLPELKGSFVSDIEENLRGSGLTFMEYKSVKKPFWVRLSLPFGLLLMLILLIFLPVKFMFTGTWNYKWQWLSNWFTALGF